VSGSGLSGTCANGILPINPRLVDVSEKYIPVENEKLRYPTKEKVTVKFRS